MSGTWNKAGVWFLEGGRLHWFCFVDVLDAQPIARRILTVWQVPAVVLPYDWQPARGLSR